MDNDVFKETIKAIGNNYKQLEKSIVSQLQLNVPKHNPTTGSFREGVWKALFEQIIPKKFVIEQGIFIIDSNGAVSKEVDLAIYDESYTPYIFNYGEIKFIPIEAVACVIQCKSSNVNAKVKGKKIVDEWAESIDILRTSLNSIARIQPMILDNKNNIEEYVNELLNSKENNEKIIQLLKEKYGEENREIKKVYTKSTQISTRPIKILCHTANNYINSKKLFDFIIKINSQNKKELVIEIVNKNLEEWHKELNHSNKYLRKILVNEKNNKLEGKSLLNFEVKNNNIMSLIFQLNQLLMLINNPMLFPHQAYVKMANDIFIKKFNNKNEEKGDMNE